MKLLKINKAPTSNRQIVNAALLYFLLKIKETNRLSSKMARNQIWYSGRKYIPTADAKATKMLSQGIVVVFFLFLIVIRIGRSVYSLIRISANTA